MYNLYFIHKTIHNLSSYVHNFVYNVNRMWVINIVKGVRSLSIKMKLSLMLSMIVFALFIFFCILGEYTLTQSMRERMSSRMLEHVLQAADLFISDHNANGRIDYDEAEAVIAYLQKAHLDIMEITLFPVDGKSGPLGSYTYHDAISDSGFVQAAIKEQFVYREMGVENRDYYRTYYWVPGLGDHVLSLVYNDNWFSGVVEKKRLEMFLYTCSMVIIVLLISYWLISRMLAPLSDILWKVNEVSSARFHGRIPIKRKDEFSTLAESINAMSQNLSIYLDKLRSAFEENRRMKEHLESFINNTSDAIVVVDLQGNVIQVNQAYLNLFEYEIDEVLDKPISIVPPSHMEETIESYNDLMKGKLPPPFETERITKSGEIIPVSASMSPIRDRSGAIFAISSITRDMRVRNRMEELLRRSEKLTTVGQLAAGVAHEIRNPLTSLRGFLQLQKGTGKLNLVHVDLMLSELDRINLIVGEFLILAKPQAVKYTQKDVRTIMGDVIPLLDSEAHLHSIEFNIAFTEQPCLISCEENQLKQVFINLLKNAIEAMPGGGSIHIQIDIRDDVAVITIIDEGVGIPEDIIEKIGDPFFTGKETGTGLGIMVSQRIIHSHQGTLDIHSQVNVGTTIVVTLPALKEAGCEAIL